MPIALSWTIKYSYGTPELRRQARAVATKLIGGAYSCIHVLPDEFHLCSQTTLNLSKFYTNSDYLKKYKLNHVKNEATLHTFIL